MRLRVLKESNKSRFDSLSRQKQCIDHITYYLSGLSRTHFSDNLSRNSCINDVNLFHEPLIAVDRLLGGNWLRA